MTRARGKTSVCTGQEAKVRLDQAEKFMESAELVHIEDIPAADSVAAAMAVLAGIAAADAACCKALGLRSRSQNHHDAESLLAQIEPGGKGAAQNLRRLIDLKDTAHYGLIYVSGNKLKSALRQAQQLIDFADRVLAS